MAISLAANALTTLAAAQSHVSDVTVASEDKIKRLINVASEFIAREVGRVLHQGAVAAELHAGQGHVRLYLKRYPILSAGLVVSFDGTALAAADFEIDSLDEGVLYKRSGWAWIPQSLPGAVYEPIAGSEEKLYSVAYTGGYVTPSQETPSNARTLPWDLEQVCLELVGQLFVRSTRDPTITSEKIGSWGASYAAGSAAYNLTEGQREILNAYRRILQA